MIVYSFAIADEYEPFDLPRVAWPTAEEARAAAVSWLADRLVGSDEADELMDWTEEPDRQDGKYPSFEAPTKHGRTVRVYPIEIAALVGTQEEG